MNLQGHNLDLNLRDHSVDLLDADFVRAWSTGDRGTSVGRLLRLVDDLTALASLSNKWHDLHIGSAGTSRRHQELHYATISAGLSLTTTLRFLAEATNEQDLWNESRTEIGEYSVWSGNREAE